MLASSNCSAQGRSGFRVQYISDLDLQSEIYLKPQVESNPDIEFKQELPFFGLDDLKLQALANGWILLLDGNYIRPEAPAGESSHSGCFATELRRRSCSRIIPITMLETSAINTLVWLKSVLTTMGPSSGYSYIEIPLRCLSQERLEEVLCGINKTTAGGGQKTSLTATGTQTRHNRAGNLQHAPQTSLSLQRAQFSMAFSGHALAMLPKKALSARAVPRINKEARPLNFPINSGFEQFEVHNERETKDEK